MGNGFFFFAIGNHLFKFVFSFARNFIVSIMFWPRKGIWFRISSCVWMLGNFRKMIS